MRRSKSSSGLLSNRAQGSFTRSTSLKVKLLTTMAAILTGGLLLSEWFIFQKAQTMLMQNAQQSLTNSLVKQTESITRYLDQARHDAIVLSHAPNIQSFITDDSKNSIQQHRHELAKQFSRLIEEKGYLQIRLIDLESGMEVVRVDRPAGDQLEPLVRAEDDLQNKGDTDYVKRGKRLQPDEVHISEINLNREYGKITVPHQPTQRFVVSVFEEEHTLDQQLGIYGLIDYIRYFDHALSTSTIRAAQTANLSWQEHYNFIAPRLDLALERSKYYLDKALHSLVDDINVANIKLIEMEETAFKLVSQGQANEAEVLLTGTEYLEYKSHYKHALKELLTNLEGNLQTPNQRRAPKAIIVINTNFNDVLSSFKAAKTHDTILTNSKSQYIYHPEETKHFSFETRSNATTLLDEEPQLWQDLSENTKHTISFSKNDKIHASKRIFLGDDNTQNFVHLIVSQCQKEVLQPINELRQYAIFITLAGISLSILLMFILLSRQIRPISRLTKHAIRISEGDLQDQLPQIKSHDEVGQLAYAFSQLIEKLQTQNQQAVSHAEKTSDLNEELEKRIAERTEKLNDAMIQAEAASQAKSEFLATMSHEIRTPLNGMLGMSQILDHTELNSEQKNYVTTIVESGESLLTIIDDILDFSKIEAGKLSIEPVVFDLKATIEDIVRLMKTRADEKSVSLNINYPTSQQSYFLGDPGRIRQVIMNLLGNAIKFTDQGQVSVDVKLSQVGDSFTTIKISIIDSGIGIAKDNQERLFKAFQQADSSTTRKYGGTGLGLAICQKLIELMGGEIGFSSTEGQGSTFWFQLSLPTAELIDESEPSSLQTENDSSPEKDFNQSIPSLTGLVLLVEDNSINQVVAGSFLEELGLDYELANNGVEAVELWQKNEFDLILMDCQMPEMDGLEATRQIRSQETADAHIPIIALTANVLQSDRDACAEAGMDGFIPKPMDFEEIARTLQKWLS